MSDAERIKELEDAVRTMLKRCGCVLEYGEHKFYCPCCQAGVRALGGMAAVKADVNQWKDTSDRLLEVRRECAELRSRIVTLEAMKP